MAINLLGIGMYATFKTQCSVDRRHATLKRKIVRTKYVGCHDCWIKFFIYTYNEILQLRKRYTTRCKLN